MSKLIIALYVIVTSSALVVLKLGSRHGTPIPQLENKLPVAVNLYTLLGVVLYGISFLLYVYLISKFDLGYIIPLTTAFVYILIFFASFAIFKESFTIFKVTGITLIVVGLIFLNLKR